MNRTLSRLATLALTIPFATAFVAGAAHAADPVTVTVPGCWGAGTNDTVVCDLTLSAQGPATSLDTIDVPVCTSSCQVIPVPIVRANVRYTQVCYSYADGWGNAQGACTDLVSHSISLSDIIEDLLDCSHWGCPST